MNPGGLDSSEPEVVPGTVFGRLAACTGRKMREDRGQGVRGNNGRESFSLSLKKQNSRWKR